MKLEKHPQSRNNTVRSFRLAGAGYSGKNKSREIWAGILVFMMIFIFVSSTFNSGSPSRDNPVASPEHEETQEPVTITKLPITKRASDAGCSKIFQIKIPETRQGEISPLYSGKIPRLETEIPVGGYYHRVKPEEGTGDTAVFGEYSEPGTYDFALQRMHEGYTIIWHQPGKESKKTQESIEGITLLSFLRSAVGKNIHIIDMPWSGDAIAISDKGKQKPMPKDSGVAFSAWGFSQTCRTWSPVVALDFSIAVNEHRIENPILYNKADLED